MGPSANSPRLDENTSRWGLFGMKLMRSPLNSKSGVININPHIYLVFKHPPLPFFPQSGKNRNNSIRMVISFQPQQRYLINSKHLAHREQKKKKYHDCVFYAQVNKDISTTKTAHTYMTSKFRHAKILKELKTIIFATNQVKEFVSSTKSWKHGICQQLRWISV